MIDRLRLLGDLKPLLTALEDDLRARLAAHDELDAGWRSEYHGAREARRTGDVYEVWRDEQLTQVAVAWVLGCVFWRFLEDNALVDAPGISGPGERLEQAVERHLLYFRQHPEQTDREYLLSLFETAVALPGTSEVFDRAHNPLWRLGPSGDGARKLLDFWQRRDPGTGELVHDFTDPAWDTRFLGDLYQDLSEAARKRFALLQTPDFVESFLLDRTLGPAMGTFPLEEVRLLDPTCGSGHFLLGGFERLLDRWLGHAPEINVRELVQRALDGVAGVDVNPFAVAIARFRLLVAALRACEVDSLSAAPSFRLHVACGDSLLHGPRFGSGSIGATRGTQTSLLDGDPLAFVYETEDRDALRRILGRQYAAVVGNPPYITVKDKALNQAYRQKYGSCHRQYSLAVPFFERFFELATSGASSRPAGFVGMITANSFMKREFGKKLVTDFIPNLDLTHVIDTSGAYIPGHGTPTVILLGQNRPPLRTNVRAVLSIRGEPSTPSDPSQGQVWRSIVDGMDEIGFENEFVSVDDKPRKLYGSHPWTLTGGGAVELKAKIESHAESVLGEMIDVIGRTTHTGEDDVFFLPPSSAGTLGLRPWSVPMITGEDVRDFGITERLCCLFPYEPESAQPFETLPELLERYFWNFRARLRKRRDFGKFIEERGLNWFEHSMFFPPRYLNPKGIAFAFVATHNHFVLDRGGKVFNRTAPVIKLPADATVDDHLALLGLLNSSVACFWLKQVCFAKGGDLVGQEGARLSKSLWEDRYEHDGGKIGKFPLAAAKPLDRGKTLDSTARHLKNLSPMVLALVETPSKATLQASKVEYDSIWHEMVFQQEELDWWCYRAYGLLDEDLTWSGDPVPLELGERTFEIVLARKMAAGELQTEWFARHGSEPITDLPAHWPGDYRRLVERRIQEITDNKDVRLIERPEYKRRWQRESWESQQERALKDWLLDRLESEQVWQGEPRMLGVTAITDRLRTEPGFQEVAELYAGTDAELTRVVSDLLASQAVPYLAAWRYKPSGLRKRRAWEQCWDLQRREDTIDARVALPESHPDHLKPADAERLKAEQVGDIAVPPKYASSDFKSAVYWRCRGKLDVPKERFIAVPGSERSTEPTPVYGWAGWNPLQRAKALAAFYLDMKENEGWDPVRLVPLLGGILEQEPWIRQWHNEEDGQQELAAYFHTFVDEEARDLGLTVDTVQAWEPPAKGRRRKVKAS